MFYAFFDRFGNTGNEKFKTLEEVNEFFASMYADPKDDRYPRGYVNSEDDKVIVDEKYLLTRQGMSKKLVHLSIYEEIENAYLVHDDTLARDSKK